MINAVEMDATHLPGPGQVRHVHLARTNHLHGMINTRR
jgi:hypothetical protein